MSQPQGMGAAGAAAAPKRKEKQAVVIVHGMGEQMPMETLRGFVETMWVDDPDIHAWQPGDPVEKQTASDGTTVGRQRDPVWFKPDSRNDSAELWRVTTRHADETGQRVDFYEFYWADVTASNTIDHLKDLFAFMLFRRTGQVPDRVFAIWLLLWAVTIFFAGLSVWKALETSGLLAGLPLWLGPVRDFLVAVPTWVAPVLKIGGVIYAGLIGFVVAYLGDVARYCRAKPPNIAARREIRERGLERIRAIAKADEYDRIVLVGHSLGSIIAYDLLKLFWAEWAEKNPVPRHSPLFDAFVACKDAGRDLIEAQAAVDEAADKARLDELEADRDSAREAFRIAQYDVFSAAGGLQKDWLAAQYPQTTFTPWLISDFVTVGAALSHSQFLLAKDDPEFRKGKIERRFPTIPPVEDGQYGYIYKAGPSLLRIDHAAVFAATRWTNLHDVSGSLSGDLVSGPVAPLFGPGALDGHVAMRRGRGLLSVFPRLFTHTMYWTDTRKTGSPDIPVQLVALRKALDLARVNSPTP